MSALDAAVSSQKYPNDKFFISKLLLTFVASPAKQRRPRPEGSVNPNKQEGDGDGGAADVPR